MRGFSNTYLRLPSHTKLVSQSVLLQDSFKALNPRDLYLDLISSTRCADIR